MTTISESLAELNPQTEVATLRAREFRNLGIYTHKTLSESVEAEASQAYMVEGLLRAKSVNLLVGDSGLGKTPLAIQIGLCVAAGVPLFGMRVEQGPVLYCDAESGKPEFAHMVLTLSRFLGLSEPPSDFHVWSPNWEGEFAPTDESTWLTVDRKLMERVKKVNPRFVIADALRTFWADAETKNQVAAETLAELRRLRGITWLLLHHRRKLNQQAPLASLEERPQAWFQETAGALALVNQSDTRLGVMPGSGQSDLLLAGFLRLLGPIATLDLERVVDEDGTPMGYRKLTGVEHLRSEDRTVFDKLGKQFRFKDIEVAMGGTSASNATRFLKKCLALGLARKETPGYVKMGTGVERVE